MVLASVMGSLSTGMDTAVPSRMVEVTAAAAPSATHGSRVRL